MQYGNKSAFSTPVINKVVYLNEQLVFYGRQLPNGKKRKNAGGDQRMTIDIRRVYFMPVLENARRLFMCAMRQLKGRDYIKRSTELIDEIQASCFLIMKLQGWNERTCAELDMICDEIAEQLYAISSAAKSQVH